MEFFIRKKSTLPILEVDLVKDGGLDFNYVNTNLNGDTIYFSMKNIDTQVYKVLNGVCVLDQETNSIYYQFTKKNTVNNGRFICEFSFNGDQGLVKLPLRENLYVNILDSFSNSEFCCGSGNQTITPTSTPIPPTPTPTPTPTPGPENPKIYFGKYSSPTITLSGVTSLSSIYRNIVVNSYVNISVGAGYSYILIPVGFAQPTEFRESTNGCDGSIIPMNNIGQIVINDINGYPTTYNIYRSFFSFYGQIYSWMCV